MRKRNHIVIDLVAIGISIAIAIGIIQTGVLHTLLTSTVESRLLGSFIAGFFFTSVFTTAPAIVALGEISTSNHIIATALVGALGSVCGDLIIFRFVHDRLSDDLVHFIKIKRLCGAFVFIRP